MKIAVLWHRDQDGWASAFAAHHALGGYKPDSGGGMGVVNAHDLLFKSVQYGEDPPYAELAAFGPDQVYILDFSYKAPVLREFIGTFPATVVIDHHKSAVEELAEFPEIYKVEDHFDLGATVPQSYPLFSGVRVYLENSGCVLSWLFFNPEEPIPELLHYVQDRDLWKWELEHSKEINAYIATLPFEFEAWADFYMPLAYDAGKAILDFQRRQIEGRVKAAELIAFDASELRGITGKVFGRLDALGVLPHIPVVCTADNISEVGEALCLAYPDAPFSMTYCDRPGGKRSYSLRSRFGFDVSEVAVAFGGGGHAGAAGFTLDAPRVI